MHDNPTIIHFNDTYKLIGENTLVEVPGANNFFIFDSLLIFTTPALDTFYHSYSTNNLCKIRSFIAKGEGPNELKSILKPLYLENEDDNIMINFYTPARQGILRYNFTGSNLNKKGHFQDTLSLENATEIYRAYKIDESLVFIDRLDFLGFNQIYEIYDYKHNQSVHLDTAIISRLQDQKDVFLMATSTLLNFHQKKYISAMRFADQVNIYDLENPEKSHAVSVKNNATSLIDASNMIMPLKKEFYIDIREAKGLIFALYANQSRKEWATGNTPAEIHVINWQGKAICKLIVDQKLLNIDIDSGKQILYGLSERQELIRYDLSQLPHLSIY
ncbi:TolB-like 6-bladed beta-propeller domain-containing protein [Algoriphagus sp. AGSA1]|uniref:BF3164 family lipoprotein n=1 Tax=Algoriphagus sp. AGSA1 TaxID=2907213 RepID=UPI001F1927F4|nr:BF3164 family lipoprotein [Algoriphagus sp. AGSA1]MCE7054759.1 TolB-like 6-bladed beta-propeller domain-containing protein [Algoriphagus sp. AGSA1]